MSTTENVKTCAFTGHRFAPKNAKVFYALHAAISEAILERGVTRFLSGMACGFDMMAAEAVLSFQKVYPAVQLVCVIPHRAQDRYFSAADKARYRAIMEKAQQVVYTGEEYTPWCMHIRDDYLVDHADEVICYLVQNKGGTFYTVSRARKRQIPIKNLAL